LVRQAAALIEKAQKAGQTVTADQYPYIASSTSLEAMLIPTWARAGGNDELITRLDDAEQGPRIRAAIIEELGKRGDQAPIHIARYQPRPEWNGKSLTQIAQLEKRELLDIVLEITRHGGAAAVSFGMNEEDVRHVMQLPWVATASDGRAYLPGPDRPHPRSYGTFPRKIGYYAIDQKVLPLAQAIRSATGLPADILRMKDRGYLKPELVADVVVFDPNRFRDAATFEAPHQYATGVRYVFIAGEPVVHEGTPTGALAGKALRRSAGKPSASTDDTGPQR
jgi:N-acyl-D-aspartate/D-glutamate deacylase